MPRMDRDLARRIDGAGRVAPQFTREQLERELAHVEERDRMRRASAFGTATELEKQELPRLGNE